MAKAKAKKPAAKREPVYGLPPVFRGPEAEALPMTGQVNWGMTVFQIEQLRTITNGNGINLGVVDTGIDETHDIIAPNFGGAKDFTGSSRGYRDVNGHGTHVSGTVFGKEKQIGVAPGAKGYHGKGLGDGGSGGSGLLRAIEWCAEQGCKVISNSWGGGGRWAELESIARRLDDAGVWLLFAGGNSGPNTPDTDWPGRSMYVINVAALNQNLTPASFSSAGDKIDTSGPGVGIWSARPGGGFASLSGTSMATPFIAGMLGLYYAALIAKDRPIPKTSELRAKLFSHSTDIHTPGDDRRTGPGFLTPLLLSLDLTPDPPPVVTPLETVPCSP